MENIEKELDNNRSIHEIFECQSASVIDTVIKRFKDNDSNEILLQININNIMPFYKHRGNFQKESEEEARFWEHLVSILFMSQLKERHDFDIVHDIEEEKKVMTREPFEIYKQVEGALLDRNDVIETIRSLGLESPRLHIVLSSFNNELVWSELINYLNEGLPFITMIYSSGNVTTIEKDGKPLTEKYKYKLFSRDDERLTSRRLLTDKQYKKVLKNEAKIQKDIHRDNE